MFTKVNSKVVKVNLGQSGPVISRRGSMLFYAGQVTFAPPHIPRAGGAPPGGGGDSGGSRRAGDGGGSASIVRPSSRPQRHTGRRRPPPGRVTR